MKSQRRLRGQSAVMMKQERAGGPSSLSGQGVKRERERQEVERR